MKKLSIASGLLIATGSLFAQQYGVTTVAGNGTAGWSGDLGPALNAQLRSPIRVAVDPAGNVYITDYGNSSIRRVYPDGTINSVTGNGFPGFSGDGGSAIGAQLSSPHDIAFDHAGNLYIADTANSRVRIVDTHGNINTFAGTGVRGFSGDGGLATSAQLFLPVGVATDSKGNVYIADAGNASVRKVTPGGIISTMAGTGFPNGTYAGEGGLATKALLGTPYSVATDGAGNVYIGDIGYSRIFRVGTDGLIHTVTANFLAQNFASDSAGNLYAADYRNNVVEKILPGGTTLWIGGNGSVGYSGDGGVATTAQMSQPYGVAVDTATGSVYVAEALNSVIRKLTPRPNTIGAIANAATIKPFATPPGNFGDATVPISAGEIVVLFGTGMGPANIVANSPTNGVFGTSLAGTTVTFAGIPAPILYTSSTIVSAIVPYGIDGMTAADVVVSYQGNPTLAYSAPVAPTAPGVFTADASGSGQALAVNLDGTLNNSSNPVRVGGFVILYATGEGATSPPGVDGKLAVPPFPAPVRTVTATVGGIPANVTYAGAAPGFVAGVMQVNLQIPSGVRPGNISVQLTINNVVSPLTTIAVQ
jgi:uncharacterized protein (TIGR03437 family)